MKYSKEEREKCLEYLREEIKPGDTIYTILRHIGRTGMTRSISLFHVIKQKGRPTGIHDITFNVSRALDYAVDQKNGGIKMGGCGMDMGFHAVYSLSRALFPHGFRCNGNGRHWEDGKRPCYSNDHANGREPERGILHADGGYALHHEWL